MFITEQPISVNEFLKGTPDPSCGAHVLFVGKVRNHQRGRAVQKLYYECYRTMAERQITAIVQSVRRKWNINEIQVLHRIGWLEVGEVAVIVSVASGHRREAFSACREAIDEVKRQVPLWKKEEFVGGSSEWVFDFHCVEVAAT